MQMKKRSETMQTLRTGCSKVDQQTNKHTNRHGQLQYTVPLSVQCKQEAQLMLTTGSTRLVVSQGQQTWYQFGSIATFR